MLKVLILPVFLALHPVHVTLTTIDQSQNSDTMKVFFRMYYDDFLRDYALYDNQPGTNYTDQSFPQENANKYFNDKVHIIINNHLLKGKIQNINVLDNEIFLNLLYISEKNPKKIKVINQVLTRLYMDQTNMIFLNINSSKEALRLTPEHDKESCIVN